MTNGTDQEYEEYEEYEPYIEPTHSGLGIASFILSILTGIGIFLLFVIAGVMAVEAEKRGAEFDENSPMAIVLGFMILGSMFMCFLSFCLGIAGLFMKNRKKVFAIIGTIFSVLIGLGTLGLLIIGMIIG